MSFPQPGWSKQKGEDKALHEAILAAKNAFRLALTSVLESRLSPLPLSLQQKVTLLHRRLRRFVSFLFLSRTHVRLLSHDFLDVGLVFGRLFL